MDTYQITVLKMKNWKKRPGISCYNPTTVHCVVT